jgi:hypothetical protein
VHIQLLPCHPVALGRRRILNFSFLLLTFVLASISAPKFEAIKKEKFKNGGSSGVAAIIEGKIMNLSVEAKVAIAVTTGFVVLIVGAMAQG